MPGKIVTPKQTDRESLRDIEACLGAMRPKLYHMGIRSAVSRNTPAHANEVRDWRIHAHFAQILIGRARGLYADEDFGPRLSTFPTANSTRSTL